MRSRVQIDSSGFALLSALLILLLLTAMGAAVVYLTSTETRLGGTDRENTLAYYGAEAAMEKMMADLAVLYTSMQAPSPADIDALEAIQPDIPGVVYSEYDLGDVAGTATRTISGGPHEGLIAMITPLTLRVTARRPGGAEVRMSRSVEVAQIPVFQFGIFSETDLSYFPGPDFDFGGRVHTNGNLFMASGSINGLKFHGRITAVKEAIRAELANGLSTTAPVVGGPRIGPIWIPRISGGCDPLAPPPETCRDLNEDEGSKVAGPLSANNPPWPGLSTNTYNGNILNGSTGARALNLPFVATGLRPIEIIRRPPDGELPTSPVASSRLYTAAQIRVLLADSPDELPGGAGDAQNIKLDNVSPYNNGVQVPPLSGKTYFAEGKESKDSDWVRPAGAPSSWPLLDGYLRVETRRPGGTYVGVTKEWLELGFGRALETPDSEAGVANIVHPRAILILQVLADRNGDGELDDDDDDDFDDFPDDLDDAVTGGGTRNNWHPINLYDTREGEVRDEPSGGRSCAIGGIMNVVELDVRNLRRWLYGEIGTTGLEVEDASQNGFILYFSDRRGMRGDPLDGGKKRGEYGFEDTINPPSSAGNPNSTLDAPEDVNANGRLDLYGRENLGDAFNDAAQGGNKPKDAPTTRLSDCRDEGRKNRVSGARHGIKLVNGSLGNLATRRATGLGGFTVGSENPVYVVGNYNASNSGYGDPHAAAAVIADAVMLLSRNWKDLNSFNDPTDIDSSTDRKATDTWYRVAVAAGKNINWPHPGWATNQDYGLDGGTHNFLRYLERWAGKTLHYRGSLVSLYYAEYATGIYKCCNTVYIPPTRDYSFDVEFLDPTRLPPGTPMLRDVVNLGFRQSFRAP